MSTKVEDYVRLAKANSTVEREFEYFKLSIFNETLKWEGGSKLHKVSGDSGGWTKWGITYNHNTQVFKNFDDFKDTTYEEAAAIAYIKYYRAVQAFILPLNARLMYFDMAYNLGNNRAIKIVQKCAGVPQDGIIGPVTRDKMQYITEDCLYKERNSFYNSLVKSNKTLAKFLKGWLNRSTAIFNIK